MLCWAKVFALLVPLSARLPFFQLQGFRDRHATSCAQRSVPEQRTAVVCDQQFPGRWPTENTGPLGLREPQRGLAQGRCMTSDSRVNVSWTNLASRRLTVDRGDLRVSASGDSNPRIAGARRPGPAPLHPASQRARAGQEFLNDATKGVMQWISFRISGTIPKPQRQVC